MDKIKITNLEVYCHHGVYAEENVLGQKFLVSAVLYTNIEKAAQNDEILESINYGEVCHYIKKVMEQHTFKLIESVAECLATNILLRFPLAQKIQIEVKKPWAPILLPIETVAVEIEREWHIAYLSIGSNLGDKALNLKQAVELLNEDAYTRVTKQSKWIITEPYGGVEQDDFLNGALEIKTLRDPYQLLELVAEIEKKLKRERIIHWGPRTIDLDILLYDSVIIQSEHLTIPHPEMQKRDFVLRPLYEIAPAAKHPIFEKNVYRLLQELESGHIIS